MHRRPELHDAVQDLAEVLGRRLIVLDRTMRVVAYSIHESPEDRRRLSHVLTHSDSWDTPATIHRAGVVQVVDDVGRVLMYRLLGSDQHIIGHLMVAPLDADEAVSFMDAVAGDRADQISRLLEARDSASDALISRSGSLAVDLVSDDDERREAAATTVLHEGIFGAVDRYSAVAVGPGPPGASPSDRSRAEEAVAQTIRFVNDTSTASVIGGVTDDGYGVLVFPRPVVAPRLARILTRPHLSPARAGIGPLTALTDLHQSYVRAGWALRATSLAPTDHPVAVHWSDTGVDGILATVPVERLRVDDLPASVRRILRDQRTRRWTPTLEAFLDSAGDIQRTARVLDLHRSTVYYRLDRLTETAEADIRQGAVQRDLHFGLRLARLAGLLDTASTGALPQGPRMEES